MRCNGKCHLKKQLREQHHKEQSPNSNIEKQKEVQFFQGNISLKKLNLSSNTQFEYAQFYSTEIHFRLLHPPDC
jgi:hypothetical protein